ncbi:MAG: hypothetical protein AAF557_10885 [Pseudomonadota bacterium]
MTKVTDETVEIIIPWNPRIYQRNNEIIKLDYETGWLSDYAFLVGSFVLALLLAVLGAALLNAPLWPVMVGCLIGFWICFGYARLREKKISDRTRFNLSWGEDIRVVLSAEGVSYGNDTFTLTTHWLGIDEIHEYKEGLFLHQIDRMASIPLPDGKLPNGLTRDMLRQQIVRWMNDAT